MWLLPYADWGALSQPFWENDPGGVVESKTNTPLHACNQQALLQVAFSFSFEESIFSVAQNKSQWKEEITTGKIESV